MRGGPNGGKRPVQTLGDRTYGGRIPSRFFADIYRLRGDLVHGLYPQPDHQHIDIEVIHLQQFEGSCWLVWGWLAELVAPRLWL